MSTPLIAEIYVLTVAALKLPSTKKPTNNMSLSFHESGLLSNFIKN